MLPKCGPEDNGGRPPCQPRHSAGAATLSSPLFEPFDRLDGQGLAAAGVLARLLGGADAGNNDRDIPVRHAEAERRLGGSDVQLAGHVTEPVQPALELANSLEGQDSPAHVVFGELDRLIDLARKEPALERDAANDANARLFRPLERADSLLLQDVVFHLEESRFPRLDGVVAFFHRVHRNAPTLEFSVVPGLVEKGVAVLRLHVLHFGVVEEVQADGLHPEPAQALLEAFSDEAGREVAAPAAALEGDEVVAPFRAQDEIVPVGAFLQEFSDEVLAAALAVGVRGVDEVHPAVDGGVEGAVTLGIVHGAKAAADGHGAESDNRYLKAGVSEGPFFHGSICLPVR